MVLDGAGSGQGGEIAGVQQWLHGVVSQDWSLAGYGLCLAPHGCPGTQQVLLKHLLNEYSHLSGKLH